MSNLNHKSVKLTSSTKEVEQIELFELDGKSYTIANKPRVNLSLKVLRISADKSEQPGRGDMLEALLGKENYETLLDFDDLTIEDFTAIVELASEVVFGELEKNPKASS